eukprot:7929-Rhodomonas_salina.2
MQKHLSDLASGKSASLSGAASHPSAKAHSTLLPGPPLFAEEATVTQTQAPAGGPSRVKQSRSSNRKLTVIIVIHSPQRVHGLACQCTPIVKSYHVVRWSLEMLKML